MATRIVCFRLTVEEYRAMRAVADDMGSPLASLFRDAVADYVEASTGIRPIFSPRGVEGCNTPAARVP